MKKIKLEDILNEVCGVMGVDIEDVCGKSRKDFVVNARRIYCHTARKHTKESFERIGQVVGVDHATAIYHNNKVKDYQETTKGGFFEFERRHLDDMFSHVNNQEKAKRVRLVIKDLQLKIDVELAKLKLLEND